MRTSIELIRAIINEINQDKVLPLCKSFSALHDHCDANMLGDFGLEDTNNGLIDIEALNDVQNRVGFYLGLEEQDRIVWLNQLDNPYFNDALIWRMQGLALTNEATQIASEIADLNNAIHQLKTRVLELEGKSN